MSFLNLEFPTCTLLEPLMNSVLHQFPSNRIHEHLTSMDIVADAIAVMGKIEFGSLISAHLRLISSCSRKDSSVGYLGNMKWRLSLSPSIYASWMIHAIWSGELSTTYRNGNVDAQEIEGLDPWLAVLIKMLFRNHGLGMKRVFTFQ